jgi:potassium channel subfamily K
LQVLATIGYGNFAPVTTGGKIFVIAYALVAIPVGIILTSGLSEVLLQLFEYRMVLRMKEVGEAFRSYDMDGSKQLEHDEAKLALQELHIKVGDDDDCQLTHAQYAAVAGGDGVLDEGEFGRLVAGLTYRGVDVPLGRQHRLRNRVILTLVLNVLWLLFGMAVFAALEGWGYLDSFYFCFVTLTTIGLGDFVPASDAGVMFNIFYCAIGLGAFGPFFGCFPYVCPEPVSIN